MKTKKGKLKKTIVILKNTSKILRVDNVKFKSRQLRC